MSRELFHIRCSDVSRTSVCLWCTLFLERCAGALVLDNVRQIQTAVREKPDTSILEKLPGHFAAFSFYVVGGVT